MNNTFLVQGQPDTDRLLLIATLEGGCPVGQIRLEQQPLSREVVGRDVVVDIVLDRWVHGFGLEAALVRQGLQVMEEHWGAANQAGLDARIIHQTAHACFSRPRSFDQQTPSSPLLADVGAESLPLRPSRITVLIDRASWLNGYLPELIHKLWQRGHAVRWIHDPEQLSSGDAAIELRPFAQPDQLACIATTWWFMRVTLQGSGWPDDMADSRRGQLHPHHSF